MIRDKLTSLLLRYYFRQPEDYLIPFGSFDQNGSLMVRLPPLPIWRKQKFATKLKALLSFNWKPNKKHAITLADEILRRDVFGKDDDFGRVLYELNLLNHHRKWNLDKLTDSDKQKIDALWPAKILTAQSHRVNGTNELLHLKLALYSPFMCTLVIPMMAKIPVVSLRFAIELQDNVAFQSIREAEHPMADELIAFIYDTLTIQQKTARSFYKLLQQMGNIETEKGETKLSIYEMDALSECDTIINYLKASVEKIILILAHTFEIGNLDTYKKHQQKLSALDRQLPPKAKEQPHFQFIWEHVQPSELEKLNNLRTGINHKRGVASLQPHSYLDKSLSNSPLVGHFDILLDQHRKNTAIFLGVLALLTDDLMFRKPPEEADYPFILSLWDAVESVPSNNP